MSKRLQELAAEMRNWPVKDQQGFKKNVDMAARLKLLSDEDNSAWWIEFRGPVALLVIAKCVRTSYYACLIDESRKKMFIMVGVCHLDRLDILELAINSKEASKTIPGIEFCLRATRAKMTEPQW